MGTEGVSIKDGLFTENFKVERVSGSMNHVFIIVGKETWML